MMDMEYTQKTLESRRFVREHFDEGVRWKRGRIMTFDARHVRNRQSIIQTKFVVPVK